MSTLVKRSSKCELLVVDDSREIAAKSFLFSHLRVPYSVNIGLSMYDKKHPKLNDLLIGDADKAMYTSKVGGKSRITVS